MEVLELILMVTDIFIDANVPAKIVSADVYSNSSSNTITFELRTMLHLL